MTLEDEVQVRRIIREEFDWLLKTGRFVFDKNIQILDANNIQVGQGTGTKIGTQGTTMDGAGNVTVGGQKLGFYGATPIVQPSLIGTSNTGFTNGGGVAITLDATFTGAVGNRAYYINDIFKTLKQLGFLQSSD